MWSNARVNRRLPAKLADVLLNNQLGRILIDGAAIHVSLALLRYRPLRVLSHLGNAPFVFLAASQP